MLGLFVALVLSLLIMAIGTGILAAIGVVATGFYARSPRTRPKATVVFGWTILAGGLLADLGIVAICTAPTFLADEKAELGYVALAGTVAAVAFLSLIPLAGRLILGAAGLVGSERTAEAKAKLHRQLDGLTIIAWVLIGPGTLVALMLFLGGIPMLLVIVLAFVGLRGRVYRQDNLLWTLALATQKGMPLAPAVEAHADQCRGRYRGRVMELADRLNAGSSLPDALESLPWLLSHDARIAARVGWMSGTLARSLREAALARTLERPFWQSFVGRFAYLVTLLLVIQAIFGFILYSIVPKYRAIFMGFGAELPAATQFTIDLGSLVVESPVTPVLLIVELAILGHLLLMMRGGAPWRVPFLDRLLLRRESALILRALAMSVEAGQTLTVGLDVLTTHHPKGWIRARLQHVQRKIELGTNWFDALLSKRLIRGSDAMLLQAAQRVGNLPWALREVADSGERRLGYRLEAWSQLLFPVVVMGIAAIVCLLAVGYFLPLIRLIEGLSKW